MRQKLLPELSLLLNEFSETDDKLHKNYKDINFNEFENYTIITYNNSIVSFLLSCKEIYRRKIPFVYSIDLEKQKNLSAILL